ncbi:polysaccharide pyruvyl transferase family protein [bacterium]|nr:polysaccharide pyruvyl transferase family protein [bacterium]
MACRDWGYYSDNWLGKPRILLSAGHGYGNVGDEAQCGACIARWRRTVPNCGITLFSPNPAYTEALHHEKSVWAPRVAWFLSNTGGPYFGEKQSFRRFYAKLRRRMLFSARMMARGISLLSVNSREATILQEILTSDLVHISGGGFLTGKTSSRLWENCLLMEICQVLGVPYILTGHNIGVFQDRADEKTAFRGLKGAEYIGLRDKGISERDLAAIGIRGDHIESTCDDALLCPKHDANLTTQYLVKLGIDPLKPWVAANFHHWGQDKADRERIEQRFAKICDTVATKHQLQIIFIAMTPSDVEPEIGVIEKMSQNAVLFPYSPNYEAVRGVIAESHLVFTMKHHPIVFAQGEGVPVVAVALDDYYTHKNAGALDNVGHARFLVGPSDYYTNKPVHAIDEVIANRSKLKADMQKWTKQMREEELSPYRRALDLRK